MGQHLAAILVFARNFLDGVGKGDALGVVHGNLPFDRIPKHLLNQTIKYFDLTGLFIMPNIKVRRQAASIPAAALF